MPSECGTSATANRDGIAFRDTRYGYNHCLFAQRVHDILSLVKYAKSRDEGDVHLVGLGKVAGPLVAAARSQSGNAIADTVVDMQGFRFENLDQHDDPMFVPGAVKYLDVDGILSLCAPAKLHLLGKDPSAIAARVYQATESASSLTFVKRLGFRWSTTDCGDDSRELATA